jgi:hypothetical protein
MIRLGRHGNQLKEIRGQSDEASDPGREESGTNGLAKEPLNEGAT